MLLLITESKFINLNNNQEKKINFILKEDINKLDEIIIKAQKIKDTMNIPIDSTRYNNKSTLGDILKKTDGFIISETGGISFRGKKIDKILINEKEVFINQNKTALDNIEYEIMEDVQLINNYRDKFNIDFKNFTSSVININTKDEFKGVTKVSLDVGSGFKNKFLVGGKGFRFSDKLNVFALTNSNNYGNKSYDFSNISQSFKSFSSEFFREGFTNFFQEDDLLRSSFNSDSEITLRKEKKRSRLGFILYYNYVDDEKNTFQNTVGQGDILFKREEQTNKVIGNSLISDFVYNYAINKKTVFGLELNNILSNISLLRNINIENFEPIQNIISEDLRDNPFTFLSSVKALIKSKLSQDKILSFTISNKNEYSESDLISAFSVDNNLDELNQYFKIKNNDLCTDLSIDKYFNKLLSVSLNISQSFLDNDLEINDLSIKRKTLISSFSTKVRGQNKKLEYSIKISPENYYFKFESTNNLFLGFDLSGRYKFNSKKEVSLNFNRSSSLIDLLNLSNRQISFNQRVLSNQFFLDEITSSNSLQFGYYYSNIIKTQSFSATQFFSRENNTLAQFLTDINGSTYIYENLLVSRKNNMVSKLNIGKGFYFGENLNLVRFRLGYSFNLSDSPIVIFQEEGELKQISNSYTASVSLEPKDFIFNEISANLTNTNSNTYFNNSLVNENDQQTLFLNLKKDNDKINFASIIGIQYFKNSDSNFTNPYFDLSATYKVGNKLSLFSKSRYLFHLFGLGNADGLTSYSANSNGTIIDNNFNRFNLNYFIAGINYKFKKNENKTHNLLVFLFQFGFFNSSG